MSVIWRFCQSFFFLQKTSPLIHISPQRPTFKIKSRQMLDTPRGRGATPNRANAKIVSKHALLCVQGFHHFWLIAHAGNVWQEHTNIRTSAWGQIESIVDAALHDTRSAFVCMCLLRMNPAPIFTGLPDADARISPMHRLGAECTSPSTLPGVEMISHRPFTTQVCAQYLQARAWNRGSCLFN